MMHAFHILCYNERIWVIWCRFTVLMELVKAALGSNPDLSIVGKSCKLCPQSVYVFLNSLCERLWSQDH